ncbi:cache domain-containing protein [Methylobacterium sp.]|uniref:hybrid sensor histidine kinase/response regulator n=1 Tax=Methylobacterium sp. TaxID=409 RepID=UPI000ED40FB1|nr:cache domain-containing protein [Methylobacterium sp.]GBU18279.1 hypothetical protein AwMethylo_24940 [Methylobacterium sp.]
MPDRRAERPPAGSPAGAAGALLPPPPLRAAWLLVGLCLVLPVALLVLAAFDNRREVLREANERVERTVRILHEHSTKVFETQRLILDRVNGRLTYADLASATEREALHRFLAEIQRNYDQVATITIVDETGALLVSSRLPPPVPEIGYADRDWFQVLRGEDPPEVYVSRSYAGRQSGWTVFNVARRIDRGDGRFHGAITVSVARDYFESFYREVDPDLAHAVLLLRADGQILAREPHTDLTSVPLDSPMLRMIGYGDKGTYTTRSSIDRVERIFSFRKLDDYPVYTGFGLSTRVVLETWRRNVLGYALVAGLTALALLAASLLALRRTRQEQVATARWRAAAAALEREAAEREAAEARFRQAQKMEALGHLTGGIAHDFNNLLTVVIGNLEMARRRAGDVEDRVRRGIEHAMDGARRAAVLTHRLLAFSRRSPLAPEPVALDRLVDGMAGLLRSTLGERIAVETVAAPDLWPVEVDVNQTENAILNLAVNARDAMPEGGRLTIETANLILDETAAAAHPEIEPGPYVTLAVTDTGTGMAPEVAARAFDPFFTTKAVGEGSGLGLAQVYGFMHQSSGTAILDSTPGVGTTVRLLFPRCAGELPPGTERVPALLPEPPESAPRPGLTVLVLEDDAGVRAVSVAALEEAGYRVFKAADGPDALDLLDAHPETALLFTDVVLAGPLDGRAVAVEALRRRPGLKVLYTTGYAPDAVFRSKPEEEAAVLMKPFTASILARRVRALLRD